ncbi:MAG: hypothetical protein HY747_09965, partial [Elusimicrobia bacterium]|nr:hypothetical protein [Elusimicrobiota bacterium]
MTENKTCCVIVGKYVGSGYRVIAENTSKVGFWCGKFCRRIRDSAAPEIEARWARAGNLFKTVKSDTKLTHTEMKQKETFARLGAEIFRLKGPDLDNIFQEETIKEIVSQAKKDQSEIQKVKEEMQAQKKRMQEVVVF